MFDMEVVRLGLVAFASLLPSLRRIRHIESVSLDDSGTTNPAIAGGYFVLSRGLEVVAVSVSFTAGVVLAAFVLTANSFAGVALTGLGLFLSSIASAYGIATFFDRILGALAARAEIRRAERVRPPRNPDDMDIFRNFGRRVSVAIGLGFVSCHHLLVLLPSLIPWFSTFGDPILKSAAFSLIYLVAAVSWLARPDLLESTKLLLGHAPRFLS